MMKVENLMKKYGRKCEYRTGSNVKICDMSAFISPLRYKNKMYLYGVNTEIGYNSEGYYLYIGPGNADITSEENGRYIFCGGEKYRIDRAEKVRYKEDVFYIWAVLRKMVEDDDE